MRSVLNISKHDSIGRRFNNLDAREYFLPCNWMPYFCTWTNKTVNSEYVVQANGKFNRKITEYLGTLSTFTGNLNGYYRNANSIKTLDVYKKADLLHFHIVHEKWLSITDWISLSEDKPIVWTWHDPYMITGHCIYSLDCKGFETGCQVCNNLDYHFPIRVDRAAINLKEKLKAIEKIDPLIVLASDHMKNLVDRSVYKDKVRIKVIPFGVQFNELLNKKQSKQRLNIKENSIVIGFRAIYSQYKGMPLILKTLKKIALNYSNLNLTIIAFQEKGCCSSFSNTFDVIETGWINDNEINKYYAAMDFFLMPSQAEAFGLMAIEAMAAGACPIVTSGTALPQLIASPIHGICSENDDESFYKALLSAISNIGYWEKTRDKRIEFAKSEYNIEKFCKKLSETYDEEIEYRNSFRRTT